VNFPIRAQSSHGERRPQKSGAISPDSTAFFFDFGKSCRGISLLVLGISCAAILSGCAGRRPVASRPPAPAQPAATPPETEESAKNATRGPTPAATPANPSRPAKRSNGGVEPASAGFVEEGNASWYGAPFHGRRASDGEIYDMNQLTAAHRTLPFNTVVRVTNLTNGKSTVVRITDRGPFVEGRVIDLSFAAAKEIESVGPGVVPVRLEILSGGNPTEGYFTVQVGAFKDRGNAERLRDRLSSNYSPIFIQQIATEDGAFYRVRVGKVSGEENAQKIALDLREKESFTPFVVRLDDGSDAGGGK
jgi:peptidoglycan lytic transglycosylase